MISNVKIILIYPKNGLVGFASFTLNNSLFLSSIGIHKKLSKEEYRLTYPQKNNKYIFNPITKELSKKIEKAIFAEYKNVISKKSNNDRYNNSECTSRKI